LSGLCEGRDFPGGRFTENREERKRVGNDFCEIFVVMPGKTRDPLNSSIAEKLQKAAGKWITRVLLARGWDLSGPVSYDEGGGRV